MTAQYTWRNGQSIYDVCLNTYGTLRHLFKLMADNAISSVNDLSFIGKVIYFETNLIVDNSLYNRNSDQNIHYTTYEAVGSFVFGEEDRQTIFISEDGITEFVPES